MDAEETEAAIRASGNVRPLLRRVLALGIGVFLALSVGELICRVGVVRANRGLLNSLGDSVELPPAGADVKLGQIIRPHPNESILYELLPELPGPVFRGAAVTTNTAGFRNRVHLNEKTEGTIRVLGLGDSVMFGWGVEDDEGYLSLLESSLNETYPERNWEVINTGVPGYNTVQEVEVLVQKGLKLEPDLVILGIVGNDYFLPNFVRLRDDPWSLRRSYLLDMLRRHLGEKEPRWNGADLKGTQVEFAEEVDPERVPPECRHLVGTAAAASALERLVELSKIHGFALVLYPYERNPGGEERSLWSKVAHAIGENQDLGVLDVSSQVAEFLELEELGEYRAEDFILSPTDPHPSALHHRLIASGLERLLGERGLIRALLSGEIRFE